MKPQVLTLSAFGPFAERQVVDFRELGAHTFFLIHGQTGTGKTSILDGICFALFGQASGRERQATEMRSDHAEAEYMTEVTFDFELGGAQFRVARTPKQERPKKRGIGTTTQNARATLWRRRIEKLKSPDDDGEVLATGWEDVNDKAVELLGFSAEQFRQVVVLPQGEFRKLLVAKVQEREKILETLFGTDHYKKIEKKLKEDAQKTKVEINRLRENRKGLLESYDVGSPSELDERSKVLREQRSTLVEELAMMKQQAEKAREELERGKARSKLFVELGQAKAAFEKVEEEEGRVRKKQQELELARQAAPIAGLLEGAKTRRNEHHRAAKELDRARRESKAAQEEKALAENHWAKEKEQEPEREAARQEVSRLEGYVDVFQKLDELTREHTSTKSAQRACAAAFDSAVRAVEERQVTLDAERKNLNEIRLAAAQLEATSAALTVQEGLVEDHEVLQHLRADLKKRRVDHEKAGRKLTEAERSAQDTAKTYQHILKAWVEGQAGVLAKELGHGLPCPVCGSREHPSPAVEREETPSRSELDETQRQMEARGTRRDQIKSALIELESQRRRLEDRESDLVKRLGDHATLSEKEIYAALAKVSEQKRAAKEAKGNIPKCELSVIQAEEAIPKAKTAHESAREELIRATSSLNIAEARIADHKKSIPRDLKSGKELKAATRKARSRVAKLETALEKARAKVQKRAEEAARAETSVERAQQNVETTSGAVEKAREKLDRALHDAGFVDEGQARKASRAPLDMSDLEALISEHKARYRSCIDRLERAKKSCFEKVRPDLVKLEEASKKAHLRSDDCQARRVAIDERAKALGKAMVNLASYEEREEKLQEDHQVIGRLSDAANGKNNLRTSFQRYVLATRLEAVLSSANERLRHMSEGRFKLERAEGLERRSSLGGLDLKVHDTHTGTSRPVATLSGGESFMASLSLALGLADVVQAEQGGVYLDTIFVDEGFGSLDPESLDRAINTLIKLERKGGRLVGIVSHVTELQSRIDARLEVKVGDQGSSARFVLG